MTDTQCVKVAELRKIGYKNLKKWMADENNLYVGRNGRIFIDKQIFHYPKSKWANPYKVGDEYTLKESVQKYARYVIDSGLLEDIRELEGKTLGCFCDQSGLCHAKVLKKFLRRVLRRDRANETAGQ